MDISDVKELLNKGEKVDVECKESDSKLSKSIWDTYSSFANTNGGYIFLGVKEDKKKNLPEERFQIQGIKNYEVQVKNFWDTINSEKVNKNILTDEDLQIVMIPSTELAVISIHVPRADYNNRPVFINGNPYKGTFKRNHEGDYHASEDEVNAMLRDQKSEGNDGIVLEHYDMEDVDPETLSRYRTMFQNNNPDHVWNQEDNKQFLTMLGGYKKDRSKEIEGLTIAGLLMFGKGVSIRERFSNLMMDYRDESNATDDMRWGDRVTYDGTWENNLFNFFMKVSPKLTADLKKPFVLDNQQRVDDTPIHKAIREAFVNMIIHSDYLLDAGTLKIIKKQDEFIFTNPGSLKLSVEEIFKGGNSKSRNPNMQLMLRMIGFGDNIGSGIPTILSAWKQEDWVEPNLYEDTHLNQVTLTLKTLATWTESVDELQDSIVCLPSVSEKSLTAMRNVLSIYNLGISPEARANMTEVASAISNAMKTVNQLDLSGLYEAVSRIAEMSKMVQPASENARKLAALISEDLKISIKSANKSANSDKKSANKSADSDKKSANSMSKLTERQKQILAIMEDGGEYTTETIARAIGLKGPRTRQILNELVELGEIVSLGTTKDRRYRIENA
ncbi:RNA-binding domain-containing protein [Lachnospiraceae bacterium YH-ros2228]